LRLLFSLFVATVLSAGATGQAAPAGPKPSSAKPASKAATTPTKQNVNPKEQARRKFVLDVVQSAVALPQADPQDRLRVLNAAANVIGPIDQKLAQKFTHEGIAIETKLVSEGQRPAVSMLATGHVDCSAAAAFVQSVPADGVLDAESSIIAAITSCPKQVGEAAKRTLEAALGQGVVSGRAILALMDAEGMNSPWSQSMFTRLFSSLPSDADKYAQEAPNYATMFAQISPMMDHDVAKTAGMSFLSWLSGLPGSSYRSVAVTITTNSLSNVLGPEAYQELLRSDAKIQQLANGADQGATLPQPTEEEDAGVMQAENSGDRTGELQAMSPTSRARNAAASGFSSGTSGDRKMADHYFDIAFASLDQVWADRAKSGVSAPEVVQEVSEAAAQVDPVAALQRTQQLQDPTAEAIGMLAVARVVVGMP
jgi:hypothetical protein